MASVYMNADLIDITGIYHTETRKAVLFSKDGDEGNAKWLPKSKIQYDEPQRLAHGDKITVTMPKWLAEREWLA